MTGLTVGILDSGLSGVVASRTVASAAFVLSPDGDVQRSPAMADAMGHGSAIARLILDAAPSAALLNAQIFTHGAMTSTAAAAEGLDWLRANRARVVSMSFGLRGDRGVLRTACEEAARAGMILIGAAPARGAPVYPSSYADVVAVTGDARCGPGEVSTLYNRVTEFGACPQPPADPDDGRRLGGASFAVGHVCGMVAAALIEGRVASASDVRAFLDGRARYRGRECRGLDLA